MVKSKKIMFIVILLMAGSFCSVIQQADAHNNDEQMQEVELTEEQKGELAVLHKNILEHKKELVDKYVEFGMLPEDKRQKIKDHLDERYQKLVENDFKPIRPKRYH